MNEYDDDDTNPNLERVKESNTWAWFVVFAITLTAGFCGSPTKGRQNSNSKY